MDVVDFKPEHSQLVYTFGGAAPVMRVRPGTALHLWSEDAFNHALTSVNDVASEVLDFRYLNPQTGPFYVEGAQPGDTLAIHVAGLTPARSWGCFRRDSVLWRHDQHRSDRDASAGVAGGNLDL